MNAANLYRDKEALDNFRGRFFLLVERSEHGDGCWLWKGPRHSSGAGRYLWKERDGGNGRYVLSHRVAYWLATGELPRYLRNLCGNNLCVRASHWWSKPNERWKPKPRKATRGRLRELRDSEIRRVRLLDALGSDEDEIAQQFGLTRRQVAQVAMGKVRPEAGGRIRSSRFRGIQHYHREFERELDSLRPNPPVITHRPVDLDTHVGNTPGQRPEFPAPRVRPSPFSPYGHVQRRHFPRTGGW